MLGLRKKRVLNLAVCLVFCLNFALSDMALAARIVADKPQNASMLRPQTASSRVEEDALSCTTGMGISFFQKILAEQGERGLIAALADTASRKATDPLKKQLIEQGFTFVEIEGKTYLISPKAKGWKLDLTKDKIALEPLSGEEQGKLLDGGQIIWIAGQATPAEIIHAQRVAKEYLEQAGRDLRIFTKDDLAGQVSKYSAQRYAKRDLPFLEKKEQDALVKRLEAAFAFLSKVIASFGYEDIPGFSAIVGFDLGTLKEELGNQIRQAIVLDEDNNPSFYYMGVPGTPKYLAVTISAGGYEYDSYTYREGYQARPRSKYTPLAMIESYMEMAKADANAMQALKAKLYQMYKELNSKQKDLLEVPADISNLINQYDQKAIAMWKEREAKKAKAKLDIENIKVVQEITQARIDKFLGPEADEIIPAKLINTVNAELQKLVEQGILTDYNAWSNGGDINMHTFRKNRNAITDDTVVLQEMVKVYLKVLAEAKKMGIYKGEDLSSKPFLQQVRALEIRRAPYAMKDLERAADPFGVFSASHTCVGVWNGTLWAAFKDRMTNAGLTIDSTMTRGFIFEVWDSQKNTIVRLDSKADEDQLSALIKQIGRYAVTAVYAKPAGKLPADEPQAIVSVKYIADDGKSEIGDANPVLIMRGQSGDPAWGELLTRDAQVLPRLSYGGNKTKGMVVLTPTTTTQAQKTPGSLSKANAVFCGYGFQLHNYHLGKPDDIFHQTYDFTKENAEKWAKIFTKLPWYMSHIREIEPYLWPHAYSRPNSVTKLYGDLLAKGRFTDLPAEPKNDPLIKDKKGDQGISNIKVDIGSKPGHKYPLATHFKSSEDYLGMSKVYGFRGAEQFDNLARIAMILSAGLDIEEMVGEKGVYRSVPNGAEKVFEKVSEFRKKVTITNWDQALEYLKQKTKDENLISLVTKLKDSQINYADFIAKVKESAQKEALAYYALELPKHRKPTAEEVEILSMMVGLTAHSALEWIKADANLRQVLGVTEDLAKEEKLSDFKVWAVGDDIQLTMIHNLQSNAPQIHTLAYNAFKYSANQVSYFKPYGWKQDILVEKMAVSGNIQGMGPGLAETQIVFALHKSADIFSADKSAPGGLTVPIIAMIRLALKAGRFANGVVFRIFDMNHKKQILFYIRSEEDEQYKQMMTLLSSPEEFAIKSVYEATRVWDGKEPIENILAATPFIDASTERLVLTAGKYVGKDDPTMIVLISKILGRGLTLKMAVEVFRYVQVLNGWMRGSHVGPQTIGQMIELKDFIEGFEGKLLATPVDFDGPPPVAGLEITVGKALSEAKDIFSRMPWFRSVMRKALFVAKMIRNNGLFSPHAVEGEETEYTNLPAILASFETLGLEKPASNEQDALVLQAALALQSKGIVHKLSEGVLGVAKDAANRKVIPISTSVLRSDPTAIMVLQSINEQINRTLGVFGSSAYIESNAYVPLLIADDLEIKTRADLKQFLADIEKGSNNAAREIGNMFANSITQEDMLEGDISNPADLIKQLQRMGYAPESLQGFIGHKEWVTAIKKQPGVSDKAIDGSVAADANTVAFAGNALFAVVEAIAAPDGQLTAEMAISLDVDIIAATSIAVVSKKINSAIEDSITAYREYVNRA